jgi:hypothetical protein
MDVGELLRIGRRVVVLLDFHKLIELLPTTHFDLTSVWFVLTYYKLSSIRLPLPATQHRLHLLQLLLG